MEIPYMKIPDNTGRSTQGSSYLQCETLESGSPTDQRDATIGTDRCWTQRESL
jgi:hypothetical protein